MGLWPDHEGTSKASKFEILKMKFLFLDAKLLTTEKKPLVPHFLPEFLKERALAV
jgi:hypothetical protein